MMPNTFKITGAREIDKVMRALGPKLAERELMKGLRAGANVVRKEIKAAAPVGTEPAHNKYGRLKDNIKVTAIKHTASSGEVTVHTGRAFWAMFLEFGTAHNPARPFLGPAAESAVPQAIERFGKTLGKGVEKTALELAGRFGAIRKSTRKRI